MKQTIRRKKSEYRKYFISYCCIALIPVILLMATIYFVQQFYYSNKSQELYRKAVSQAADHIDSMVREFQASVSSVDLDMGGNPDAGEEKITSFLRIVENSNFLQARVCFYRIGSMNIHTTDGLISYREFENKMAEDFSTNFSSFFTKLHRIMTNMVIPLYSSAGTGELSDCLAVLVPYYGKEPAERGIFAFIVGSEQIQAMAEAYIGILPDYFYLYDSNLKLLSAREAEPQSEEMRLQMIRSITGMFSKLAPGGRPCDILHHVSSQYGLHIVAGNDLDLLYFNTRQIRGRLLWILIPTLAGLILLAYGLARYSYRPIRELLDTVDHGSGADLPEDGGELEFIGSHLKNVQIQVRKLNETIAHQEPYVHTQVLAGMLRGSCSVEQARAVFPEIRPDAPAYVVLLAMNDRDPSLLQACMDELRIEEMQIYGIWLEGEECFAFICLPESAEDIREDQCRELYEQLLAFGIASPRLNAGGMVDGMEKLPRSFLEAYFVLNRHLRKDGEEICLYRADRKENWAEGEGSTSRVYDMYLQSLHSVDYSAAVALLENLLDNMNAVMPYGGMLNNSYTRFNLYSNALAACEPEVAEQFSRKHISTELFNDGKAFSDLMTEVTESNCRAVEARRSREFSQKRDNILTLVHTHCYEPDFSLSRLSEMAHYSPTYINRFLREETGLTYIQYVSGLRMEKAKMMLSRTGIRVRDIVPQCGYMDLASFTRKFKDYTGITPGEYRAQMQDEKAVGGGNPPD